MDILDKLKIMADLPAGSFLPKEICPDGGTNRWDIVISNLCRDAVREITTLRDFRQASIKALARAYKPEEHRSGIADSDVNTIPYGPWGSPFVMNFGEKKGDRN